MSPDSVGVKVSSDIAFIIIIDIIVAQKVAETSANVATKNSAKPCDDYATAIFIFCHNWILN